jgi:hypothetical protein
MSRSKCILGLVVFQERYFPYIGKHNRLKRSWSEPDLHAASEPFGLDRVDSCSVGSVESRESFKPFTTPPESSVDLSEFGEDINSSSSGDCPPLLQSSSDDELVHPAAEAAEDSEVSSEDVTDLEQERLRNEALAALRQMHIHRMALVNTASPELRALIRQRPRLFSYLLDTRPGAFRGRHQ